MGETDRAVFDEAMRKSMADLRANPCENCGAPSNGTANGFRPVCGKECARAVNVKHAGEF